MGLAVGFILGGAVAKLVSALVADLISPILGIFLGAVNLAAASVTIGSAEVRYGDFLSVLIDFLVVALVVYGGVKVLKLDRLDKKKDA